MIALHENVTVRRIFSIRPRNKGTASFDPSAVNPFPSARKSVPSAAGVLVHTAPLSIHNFKLLRVYHPGTNLSTVFPTNTNVFLSFSVFAKMRGIFMPRFVVYSPTALLVSIVLVSFRRSALPMWVSASPRIRTLLCPFAMGSQAVRPAPLGSPYLQKFIK